MIVRVGKFLFIGLLFGYLAAFILSRSIWMEMRTNTSLVILIMTVSGGVSGFSKNLRFPKKLFWCVEILLIIVIYSIYKDFGAFMVIPAVKFREAFFLGFFSLPQANALLFLLMVIGNVLWCIPSEHV